MERLLQIDIWQLHLFEKVNLNLLLFVKVALKSVAGLSFIKLYNVVSMATSFCISFFAIQLQATWI